VGDVGNLHVRQFFELNSASEAVVGSLHQRADEAERKAQGEASALISTVRKAPQPSAGK
jgi:hypothetical protein